jgi:hypothetical protein
MRELHDLRRQALLQSVELSDLNLGAVRRMERIKTGERDVLTKNW